MTKELKWNPVLISKFWDGMSEAGVMDELSFGKLNSPALIEFISIWARKDARCIDFGGGSGHLAGALCAAGFKTAVLEPSRRRAEKIVGALGAAPNFIGVYSDADSGAFDLVTCCEVIEHVPPEAIDHFVFDLSGRVEIGGRLILTTPYRENLLHDQVYCPNCDHSFHRWQHLRSFELHQIGEIFSRSGFEIDWLGAAVFDDPEPFRDFAFRQAQGEPWPWTVEDGDGRKWPLIGRAAHIVLVARKIAPCLPPKPVETEAEAVPAEKNVAAIIGRGLTEAHAMNVEPIIMCNSASDHFAAAGHIKDDALFEAAIAGVDDLPPDNSSRPKAVIFPGSLPLYESAVASGRIAPTKRALVCEQNAWRTVRPVSAHPVEKLPSRRGRLPARVLGYGSPLIQESLRMNKLARKAQPIFDNRVDAVAATLLSPVGFPFRMAHFVEKRILLGVGGLYSGGAERQILNTVEGLRQRGVEDVHLLVEHLDDEGPNAFYRDKAASVAASIVRPANRPPETHPWALEHPGFRAVLSDGMVGRILNNAETIRRLSPEVVQTSLDWTNLTVGLAAVLAGVPYVFLSGRNLGPEHFEFFQWFMLPCYQALARHPNVRFLNNSEAGKSDYCRWLKLSGDSIRVLRNGLHTKDFPPVTDEERLRARKALGLAADQAIVAGVFRFSEEKRPTLWIDAAAFIKRKLPDAVFLLCGAGKMQSAIERRAAENGLGAALRILGLRRDIREVLAAADLVMLTSLQEGTPNALIEAQAMGLPVVTTPAFGAAEAVDDGVTGAVVKRETALDIAAAAVSILQSDSARVRARSAGPGFVRGRFGFDRMIDETLGSYADAGASWACEMLPQAAQFDEIANLSDIIDVQGLCAVARAPQFSAFSDSIENSHRSKLVVLEDGRPLTPPHSAHDDIRRLGGGRYSHWGDLIFFSSTDGSSPSGNGRRYQAAMPRGSMRGWGDQNTQQHI